jgi:uncharacterized protein (TIGR03435 family)
MTRWLRFAAPLIIAVLFNEPSGCAQSAEKRPEFEVASIKRSKGCNVRPGTSGPSSWSPYLWNLSCRSLRSYIEIAYATYDGPRRLIPYLYAVGGPDWVDTELYDIVAKAGNATPYWQMTLYSRA